MIHLKASARASLSSSCSSDVAPSLRSLSHDGDVVRGAPNPYRLTKPSGLGRSAKDGESAGRNDAAPWPAFAGLAGRSVPTFSRVAGS